MKNHSIQQLETYLPALLKGRTGVLLLGAVSGVCTVAQAWLLATGLALWWQQGAAPENLWRYWCGFAALSLVRGGLLFVQARLTFTQAVSFRQSLRTVLLSKLTQAGPVFVRQRPLGDWVSLLLQQVDALHDYYARYRPQQLMAMVLPLLFWLALIAVDVWAGFILMLTAPLIPIFMVLVGNQAARASRANQTAMNRLAGHFLNRVSSLPTLRLYRQAHTQAQQVYQAADQLRLETLKVLKIAFLSSAVLEFFTALSIALVAVYLGMSYLGYLDIRLSEQPLLLFTGLYVLLLVPEFFQPLRDLGSAYHAKAMAEGAATLLLDTLQALPEIEGDETKIDANASEVGVVVEGLTVKSFDGNVLLNDVSFTLAPGETLLLCGPSGGGKTTLLETLMGFHSYQGTVCTPQGKPVADSLLSWQGQELALLAASVRENLTLGCDYSDQALWLALECVDLSTCVQALPDQLSTEVGEGGHTLSAGQRQRLLLARALLKPGALLLLDEPTAALDLAGAEALVARLQPLLRDRTCLIVSHRPELLALADRVMQMDRGRLTPAPDSVFSPGDDGRESNL